MRTAAQICVIRFRILFQRPSSTRTKTSGTKTNLLPSIGFASIHQRLLRDALEPFSVPDNRVTSQIGNADVRRRKASCSGRRHRVLSWDFPPFITSKLVK